MFDVHVPLPVSLRSPYVQVHTKEQGSGKSLGGRTVLVLVLVLVLVCIRRQTGNAVRNELLNNPYVRMQEGS